MTYELCLEYGTYPLTFVDAYLGQDQEAPDFISEDAELIEKIDTMNELFHELFLTIECQFHYIGSEYPEKRAQIKDLYQEVTEILKQRYSDYDIIIEHFILH